ncbi:N-acetyltransferase [Aliiroseovarius zhejiangensis]|uniref:N-acetyltransferase n=1 Tax=Aliiroseovarius zhejiangensis TaxID=1632025 RepID=A0ABQ3IY41_9RHOB|nr:GNAT family N-acetyltransferase [Aliiroseovarius zhejiangensis]GHE95236.1 N-acetyltransferase [Aliiroseovarius zhejiangensis]
MMTRLVTDRLMMRRLQPSDAEAFHALVSHFDVVRMTSSWPWPADPAFTRSRCHPCDPVTGMAGPVFHRGQLVGAMGIMSRDEAGPEMGYMFAPEHWGRGFATEMGQKLITHVWAQYDWDVVRATAFFDNPASARVLTKLGFVETEPTSGRCVARGGDFPLRSFILPRPAGF